MTTIRTFGAALAAAFLGLALAACKDIPPDATYAEPEKPGIYYEEPTAAEECQDEDGGPECPDPSGGPVEQPEKIN